MAEEQHSIDEIFRQSLDDYREAPPAGAWDAIEQKLDPGNRNRRPWYWLWFALCLLVIAAGGWLLITLNHTRVPTALPPVKADTTQVLTGVRSGAPASDTATAGTPAANPPSTANESPLPSGGTATHSRAHKRSHNRGTATNAAVHRARTAPARTTARQTPGDATDTAAATTASAASQHPHITRRTGRRHRSSGPIASNHSSDPSKASETGNQNNPDNATTPASSGAAHSRPAHAATRKAGKAGKASIAPAPATDRPARRSSGHASSGASPQAARTDPGADTASATASARTKTAKTSGKRASGSGRSSNTTSPASRAVDVEPVIVDRARQTQPTATNRTDKRSDNKATAQSRSRSASQQQAESNTSTTEQTPANSTRGTGNPRQQQHRKKDVAANKVAEKNKTFEPESGSPAGKRDLKTPGPVTAAKKPLTVEAATEGRKKVKDATAARESKKSIPANAPAAFNDPKTTTPESASAGKQRIAPQGPAAEKKNDAGAATSQSADPKRPYLQQPAVTDDDSDAAGGEDGSGSAQSPAAKIPNMRMFQLPPVSLSVLGGYEWALKRPAANQVSFGAELLFRLNSRISLGVRPAYRFGDVSEYKIADQKSGFRLSPVTVDSSRRTDTFGNITYFYILRQRADSIRTPAAYISGRVWDLTIPLVVHYQVPLSPWRIFGGPSIGFGGRLPSKVAGSEQVVTLNFRDSIARNTPLSTASIPNYFGLNARPPYEGNQQDIGTPASVRLGYIAGFGFEHKRVFFDATVQQQLTGVGGVNTNVRSIYNAPSFRINIGYRLFGVDKGEGKSKSFIQRL